MMQEASRAHAPPLSLRSLADLHDAHALKYYRRRDGSPTREHLNYRSVLDRFVRFAGDASPASKINRHQVRAWLDQLAAEQLTRTYIAACLRKLRTVVRWAADLDYLPLTICADLSLVRAPAPGRSQAKEPTTPQPAALQTFAQLLPHLPTWARSVLHLQMLTGARPSELLELRQREIHTDSSPRLVPTQHKNAHRNKPRVIPLSPQALNVIEPWRRPFTPDDFVFNSSRSSTGRFSIEGYRSALKRAAKAAGLNVASLLPYDARRAAAIAARSRAGLDAAQALLGHAHASTTEIYAPLPAGDQRTYDAARRAQEVLFS